MIRYLWPALALTCAALAQTTSGPVREGGYWVDTVTGTVAAAGQVRVTTTGAAHVEGEQRGDIGYTLRRRVRANDLAAARALLDRIVVKPVIEGDSLVLAVIVPDPRKASADLRLLLPRRVRETAVDSNAGAIDIRDLSGMARVTTGAGAITVNRVGGAVTVQTGGGTVHLDQIGGKVDCFTSGGSIIAGLLGADATLGTGGGEIVVRQAKGMVRARATGGNIRIERADRGVQASAVHGLVDVVQAGGPVRIETGAGSIRVRASSNVHCESETGTIQLQATSGGLRAITKTGSILADLSGVQKLDSSALVTTMGDITVLIPSNLRVTVEATNPASGLQRIVSDFGAVPRSGTGSVTAVAVNGGGPVLRLTTARGTIYLRRQK